MSLKGTSSAMNLLRGSINSLKTLTLSAYAIAVKHGYEGTEEEWLRSLSGGEVDDTLSIMGVAADAKVTGDRIKAIADTIDNHKQDKNNPHEMTAEQVGARPADWMPSAEEVGARPNTWTPTASDVGARPDNWMPTAEQVGARANTWLPTIEEIGAAPSGYGLGRSAVSIPSSDNLNNYKVGGWYQFTNGVANAPFDYGMMLIIHGNNYANDTFQYAFSRYPANNMAIRQLFDGSWGAWEWINPPMAVGVEYRTTERYDGAPVYTQLVDLGTTTETFSTTVTIDGITRLIRAVPILNDSVCTDWDASAGFNSINAFYFYPEKSANRVDFRSKCASARTGKNLKAQIWYTK